jgi:hypothetical protein
LLLHSNSGQGRQMPSGELREPGGQEHRPLKTTRSGIAVSKIACSQKRLPKSWLACGKLGLREPRKSDGGIRLGEVWRVYRYVSCGRAGGFTNCASVCARSARFVNRRSPVSNPVRAAIANANSGRFSCHFHDKLRLQRITDFLVFASTRKEFDWINYVHRNIK